MPSEHAISIPDALPILPLRNSVLFPLTAAPIWVGQASSLKLIEEVRRSNRLIGVVAQRNEQAVPARPEDLYRVGTLAMVNASEQVRGEQPAMRIFLQGLERLRILDFVRTEPYLVARFQLAADTEEKSSRVEVLTGSVRTVFRQLVELSPELPDELVASLDSIPSPRHVAYFVASTAGLPLAARQDLLDLESVTAKLERLVELLKHEIAVKRVVRDVTADTVSELSKAQREAILRQQMESIQRELGEVDTERAEALELKERLSKLALPEEARNEADRELGRLERIPSASPEHGIIRTYLDWVVKLPWGKTTGGRIDERRAREVLDEDHYDLDKVKDRIIEYLAVKALREQRGEALPQVPEARLEPILGFVGPPGVGKTSLGQSIARALGRKFAHVSLGGVHDEAEIRGHRRTYIGALPGRILQAISRAGAADPVFMLDEVDKLGRGFQGDPAAALLEVLDPAQNHAFVDSYLGVAFDLSRVLFICTANTTDNIPLPLLDRMEMIALAGYIDAEKLHIAERYLVPRQRAAQGLLEADLRLDAGVIDRIIRDYTREAGVRNLERELAGVFRKVAQRVRGGAPGPVVVSAKDLPEYLGPPRFFDEVAERIDRPGVATGLAWTPAGGDILFVEAALMSAERSRLVLTGMLGHVMRESARAALSWLRSNADRLGIDPSAFHRKEVHVHVPAGAIPKDGPSAGVTIATALASQALGRPVRSNVAMTGEITLRGKVLPVGGIKEKVLAAHRAGIETIILPKRNQSAIEDVPEEVRKACEFIFVETVGEVLVAALGVTPRPREVAAEAAAPH